MTYEQRITAEFEQEIAERDMEIERLRADNGVSARRTTGTRRNADARAAVSLPGDRQ